MNKIPIVLLNGSLGSGKTTLVKQLLGNPAFAGSFLIENEYASVNIDRESLGDEHDDEIYEISGSCICCSSGEELEAAFEAIAAKEWTRPVILEATGMANSALLLQRLFLNPQFAENFSIMSSVIMVDAAEVTPDDISKNLELEAKLADVIIINKADLVPGGTSKLESMFAALNPTAIVLSTSQSHIDPKILAKQESQTEVAFAREYKHIGGVQRDESTHAVIDIERPLDPEKVRLALRPESFPAGMVLRRAKGFFRDAGGIYWQVEATPKHIEVRRLKKAKPSVIVVIGEGITRAAVQEVLR